VNNKKFIFISFMAAVVIWAASGCSVVDWYAGRYVPFTGTWKFKDSAQGPLVVKFNRDMTYEVDTDGNGTKDIWGEFKLHDSQVTLQDVGGAMGGDCHEGAVYLYQLSRSELRFAIVGDQCKSRVAALAQPWVRVEK